MDKLIQHHVKYKEIHGVDEIKLMTWSEHNKFHRKLRKDGRCNIPACSLRKIATKAHYRTEGYKEKHKNHRIRFSNSLGNDVQLIEELSYNPVSGNIQISSYFKGKRIRSDRIKATNRTYNSKVRRSITFHETIGWYVDLWEIIRYNENTGIISYNSGFQSKKTLPEVDI